MSTYASGGTGIFAKLVAQFLVTWIKRTRDRKGSEQPSLSATPSPLTGPRPERDRSRENCGAHAGSQGVRASQASEPAGALRGGSYGDHGGSTGPRPAEATAQVAAMPGGTHGEHRGTAIAGPQQPIAHPAGQRPTWSELVRQEIRAALQRLAQAVLKDLGLGDHQTHQVQQGHVPAGHRLTPSGQAQWQLTPSSPESQLATNQHHTQTTGLAAGQSTTLTLPAGRRATVLILEVSQ